MSTLRVGIVGVSSEQSWGREAHVPSVLAVDGLTLAAVATRDQSSADEIAPALGADRGYGDPLDLIADPDIDIVTIVTPVPTHHDLLLAALRAGKHVVTEWPVGTSTAQTEHIAAVADESGVYAAVDLQSRLNPAAARAGELLRSGIIGRVLSATVFSTTAGFGPTITESARSLEDPAVGMNLTTIQAAHTIDFALRLIGPLSSVSALRTIQYPDLKVGEDRKPMRRSVPDHVLIQGRLRSGGALIVQVVGGRPSGQTPFRMDIVGEHGTLTLAGGADRGFQAGLLHLEQDGVPVHVDDGPPDVSDSAYNVSHVYAALREDITHRTHTVPDFAHATRLSRLMDDLITSDDKQRAVTPASAAAWPS